MSDPEPWEPDPAASFDLFELCLMIICLVLIGIAFGMVIF